MREETRNAERGTRNTDPTTDLPWARRLQLVRRNWEHRGRDALLAAVKFFLARSSARDHEVSSLSSAESRLAIRRVLIIRTGKAIGDAVLSLVLAPECRRLFPTARLDLLLRDNVSALFREGAGVDALLELHPRFLLWPLATCRLLASLRGGRYDLVVACDNPHKSSFTTLCLALWTGSPLRVGFENEESGAFLSLTVPRVHSAPVVSSLLRLLSPFGGVPARAVPHLIASPSLAEAAGAILGDGACPIVIFAPDHWRKSWSLEFFVRMAREMTERKHRVFLAFGPGDRRGEDSSVREWIEKSDGLGRVLPSCSLPMLAAVLSRCRLFMSNDCGPYHVAVAAGASCVAAFLSPETLNDFGYQKEGSLVAVHDADPERLWHMARDEALRLLCLR